MKKTTIILFCILMCLQAKAQFSISYSFGYGTYKMDDMKNILTSAKEAINSQYPGLDAQIVDNFPGYITHTLDVGYRIQQNEFGQKATFLTTGGKLSRADYSGEYEEKITLSAYRQGVFYRNYFYTSNMSNNRSLSLFGEISPSVVFTKMKTEGHTSIGNETQHMDQIHLNSTSFAILPQIGLKFNLNPHIGFLLSSGYDFNFGSGIDKLGGNTIDWSGFRVSLGASYTFNQ